MKTNRLFGIAVLVTALVFSFTACDDGNGGGGGGGGGGDDTTPTFTSVDNLGTWLSEKPYNTESTPYAVKLNVSDLAGISLTLMDADKYVSLDLSGSTFTSIEDDTFHYCVTLTSVTIPSGVTTIGKSAFSGCISLTSVTFAANSQLITIDEKAFSGCTSLTSVTIPASVTSIGEWAFSSCDITSVTIPSNVTSIGEYAFGYCANLTSVTIGNSVTTIGEQAFGYCTNLASVTFENTIANIHYNAFYNLGDLRTKFYATDSENGTPGTYTRTPPLSNSSVWTKQ